MECTRVTRSSTAHFFQAAKAAAVLLGGTYPGRDFGEIRKGNR
jgi:hypothetical protein